MTLRAEALAARVRRARGACGRGITYSLGQGGFYPRDPLPTRNARCDCSGFVAWALMISRHQAAAEKPWSGHIPWIETTAIVRDATGKQRLFKQIAKPVVGCIIVYPDRKVLGVRKQGHVGIVTGIVDGVITQVVHCSSGNSRRGDAIQETGSAVFMNGRQIYCLLNEDFAR